MKGSDKWGQGSGPRIELVVGVLVALSLIGVAFYYIESSGLTSTSQTGKVGTVSTTGTHCNDSSMPQFALAAEQNANFTGLSNGLCYNYFGQSGSPGSGNLTLTFFYFNGTITYPCGTYPTQLPASEIQVVTAPDGEVVSAQVVASPVFEHPVPCDQSIPVWVVAVNDVESTIPAVPQLNLTLAAGGAHPITSLRAVLTLDGGSQTFQFSGVTSSSQLRSPNAVSLTEIVLSSVSFASNEIYPMTVSGTLDNGQTFSYVVHVQIAHVP